MKYKWLAYTVVVGLVPCFSRLIVFTILKETHTISLIEPSDFIAFGLVLHISNINALEHVYQVDDKFKTTQNGLSLAFIAIYGLMSGLIMITEIDPKLLDVSRIVFWSIALAGTSFLISYTVFHKLHLLPPNLLVGAK